MAKYDKFTSLKNPGRSVQVESAVRDGNGKNIENNYAKQTGYYGTMTVGSADLAENLRTEQGASVEDVVAQLSPISVAVGDGDFAEMTNIKGRSFAYNQLVQNGNFADSSSWNRSSGTTFSVSNNIGTFTASSQYGSINQESFNLVAGHKYMFIGSLKCASSGQIAIYFSDGTHVTGGTTLSTNYQTLKKIISVQNTGTRLLVIQDNRASGWDAINLKNIMLIDLTAMGIDSDDVDEALAALRSYGIEPTVYNEYSEGKIIDSQPNKIISRGFNQWDEVLENGKAYQLSGGSYVTNGSLISCPNKFRVSGNKEYYFKCPSTLTKNNTYKFYWDKNSNYIGGYNFTPNSTFTTPANAYYMAFSMSNSEYGTTYNNDICINVSNPTLNGTYKPFVKDEHALTLPVMRSAGSVADDKDMVRVDTVDLGTLNWSYNDIQNFFYTSDLTNAKGGTTISGNCTCPIYRLNTVDSWANMDDMSYGFAGTQLRLKNNSYTDAASLKAAMSGVMLNFERATPVAQDPAINLPQNIKVYNGGTLETQYESPNTTPALVSMLYQVNLKNFIEGVGSKEDINWNPQNVASQIDVDKKAYKDRYYDSLGAGYSNLANNLIATKGLTINDDPMSFGIVGGAQKSAVGDGNATLNKLVCVDVVKNQLINATYQSNFTISADGITATYNVSSHKVTITGTAIASGYLDFTGTEGRLDVNEIEGHKYLYALSNPITYSGAFQTTFGTSGQIRSINLISISTSRNNYIQFRYVNGETYNIDTEIIAIDLTQRYGSNEVVNAIIGSDTSTQVAKLLAFDPEILNNTDYDEGTLVPSKTAKLVSKDEDNNILATLTLPNYEGHGILKVENGKVVADGTELYPDGNSKKRYDKKTFVGSNDEGWVLYNESKNIYRTTVAIRDLVKKPSSSSNTVNASCDKLPVLSYTGNTGLASDSTTMPCMAVDVDGILYFRNVSSSVADLSTFLSWLSANNVTISYELANEEDIETPVYQSNFSVEHGGTLQFLDENDNPIAGLQGNEIFYQKNIKAFVEAFGEAIDWNPDRIERLAKLSITPEYVNISLNPTQANAYAVAQVYNATFTIVISTALTGTADSSITFQDSEIDLSSFETQPAESIIDMDGKKASEEPTTPNCNIASFIGRSYNGVVLWSLLHSGVNKVKVHFEQSIPLDSEGNGKLDCRASMIL